uniref:Uncharacterized protein n=1 Tax=Leersia perrieri TaxID=77586 RepID=A0A0D9X6Y9_9ORYZ
MSTAPTKKAIRNSGGGGGVGGVGGAAGPSAAAGVGARGTAGNSVKFARRTSSGRYVSLSREDIDPDGELAADYTNYTVQIPPTPDNQPMMDGGGADQATVAMKAEEQYVSSSLFTGGFNSVTRAHLMDKVIESEVSHPQMAGAKGSRCAMPACDGKVMRDERGHEVDPCECRFKICRDCYLDAQKDGCLCPGCKEHYKIGEFADDDVTPRDGASKLHLPAPGAGMGGGGGSSGGLNTNKSLLARNQNGEFDHNRWLFESSGTYGYGNAFWPKGGMYDDDLDDDDDGDKPGGGGGELLPEQKPFKPLTRKMPMPTSIISPYRIFIVIRMFVLVFYLTWRIRNPNMEALWLWGMSIVCELWFAFSWLLDMLPKVNPVNRSTDLAVLKEKFETPSPSNPHGRSDLPGLDVFVSTADPEKEPVLTTANTILSILAVDYPVEKLACYVSDDGGALLTFEAMAEAASFANVWVPFCKKHDIEPRNPDSYFAIKGDPTKGKRRSDFVKDRRKVKREYDEFKVRINGLPDSIRRRSDAFNAREDMKLLKHLRETGADPSEQPKVMLKPPSPDPLYGMHDEEQMIDFSDVDIRLPMLVYMSREKRPGYDHNKKAGAMNALVRCSAVMSNGPFMLNFDCDHYINNAQAVREAMCFFMDRGGERIAYIQFPQRFEGIDKSDRYANHNTVFFDGNMRALDGLQGPMYVGTGCMFRRFAVYGFEPPRTAEYTGWLFKKKKVTTFTDPESDTQSLKAEDFDAELTSQLVPRRFGNSSPLMASIPVAEFQSRPLADHPAVLHGRPPGALTVPRPPLDPPTVAEAVSVISCWYEDKTEWGDRVGWIYGSVTEDVVTGYRMHNRGWRSVYCITRRDAFLGTAPINLTDRLHQVLRWATGSVEIFFSRNNAFLASRKLMFLQRVAYLNVGIYPFTSIFLLVYCFIPALSLFSGFFIVQTLNVAFLLYLLTITITLIALGVLEVKWSGIALEDWWRNEQFWLISGTSAHLYAVVQGLLKVMAGIEISFTLTAKAAADENEDIYADLYIVKWSSLLIPPITIGMINIIAIAFAFARTVYSDNPRWGKFIGGGFFSFWVLAHLYPFAKGLMGRRGKTPTIVFVWSGLISITVSLLWVAISPPEANSTGGARGGGFQFP